MKHFYQWMFDGTFDEGWSVGAPESKGARSVSVWEFSKGKFFDTDGVSLRCAIEYGTKITNVCFSSFSVIHVRSRLAIALSEMLGDQVQLIPIELEGCQDDVYILNILNIVDCIDESESIGQKWEVGNTQRPDKAGMYMHLIKMVIDPGRTVGLSILRPWGWSLSVVVSEEVKNTIEGIGAVGTKFLRVSK
ncbi:MAG: hypothetical protein ABIT83_04130 [Massilia sp.]